MYLSLFHCAEYPLRACTLGALSDTDVSYKKKFIPYDQKFRPQRAIELRSKLDSFGRSEKFNQSCLTFRKRESELVTELQA